MNCQLSNVDMRSEEEIREACLFSLVRKYRRTSCKRRGISKILDRGGKSTFSYDLFRLVPMFNSFFIKIM